MKGGAPVDGWEVFVICLIGWTAVTVFFMLPKKLPSMDNWFVYFGNCMMVTSAFTLLEINWKLIHASERLGDYFCREISRYIIFPVLLLIFVNLSFCARTAPIRWMAAVLTFAASLSVHYLIVRWKIVTFIHWNMLYSAGMLVSFMALAWLLEKVFANLHRKEAV
jgi:hypothetical protein